jgi:hypothetical protein
VYHHLDRELDQISNTVAGRCNFQIDEAGDVPSPSRLVQKELFGMAIAVCEARRLPSCGDRASGGFIGGSPGWNMSLAAIICYNMRVCFGIVVGGVV